MKSLLFIYKNQNIEFLQGRNDVMVNATQMAKIFKKRAKDFLKNSDTQKFISCCMEMALKRENSPFLNVKSETDLVNTKQKTGTYMHRVLALKFAAWLDPEFELWVFLTIDKILYSYFQDFKTTTVEKLKLEKEKELMREELLRKHPDDFYKFLELEGRLTKADQKRIRAIRASTKELKLDLFPEEITKS
jgi:hypothetical protein